MLHSVRGATSKGFQLDTRLVERVENGREVNKTSDGDVVVIHHVYHCRNVPYFFLSMCR